MTARLIIAAIAGIIILLILIIRFRRRRHQFRSGFDYFTICVTFYDDEALFKYASDPDVGTRAGWEPHRSIEESRLIIHDIFTNDHTWAIELKETGEAIGCIGYYTPDESNIGCDTIWSDFFIDNPASGRVMEKCGFRDTGELNYCSNLVGGPDRPVHIMRLDYSL